MEKQIITAMDGDNLQSSEAKWVSPADSGAQTGSGNHRWSDGDDRREREVVGVVEGAE